MSKKGLLCSVFKTHRVLQLQYTNAKLVSDSDVLSESENPGQTLCGIALPTHKPPSRGCRTKSEKVS